jgi:hypothetical protein
MSWFMAGVMVGALLLGRTADLIGRRANMALTTLGILLFNTGGNISSHQQCGDYQPGTLLQLIIIKWPGLKKFFLYILPSPVLKLGNILQSFSSVPSFSVESLCVIFNFFLFPFTFTEKVPLLYSLPFSEKLGV